MFLAILSLPFVALADRYETTQLYKKGLWLVELTYDKDDDEFWCAARTQNSQGQDLSITAFQNSQLYLFVFDGSWNISEKSVNFLIDIDYSRWNIEGNAEGISVSFRVDDKESGLNFLGEIAKGNAVALLNSNERRLATFSLSGSSASLYRLTECWKRIIKSDPFAESQNGQNNKSDPFQ